MSIFSSIFGFSSQSAVVVVLDAQLPYGDPQEHARILTAIVSMAKVRVDRRVYTILSPGSRDRSRAIIIAICEHYFREVLGSGTTRTG
jgi:hypothetical protein